MARYQIQVKGKQFGPFESTEIKSLVDNGKLGPMDFIRTEGQPNWIQASKVKGLDFTYWEKEQTKIATPEKIKESPKSNPNINYETQLWYYSKSDKQFGPISFSKLRNLVSANQLLPTDMIWKEGMDKWVTANTVQELFYDSDKNSHQFSQPPPLIVSHEPTSLIAGLHNQRLIVGGAAVFGIFATFLPWVHAPIVGSVSGTGGPDGWVSLLLFVPALSQSLTGSKFEPFSLRARLTASLPAFIAALLGIYKIIEFNSKFADVPSDNPFAQAMIASIQIGIGIYVLVAAGITITLASLSGKFDSHKAFRKSGKMVGELLSSFSNKVNLHK